MANSVKHTPAFWDRQFGTAEGLRYWHFYAYEYIDDLAFMPRAAEVLRDWPTAAALIEAVEKKFRWMGWDGDGEIQVMWFPPFVGVGPTDRTEGCYALHVKQDDDGISWIASPYTLPFHRLFQGDFAEYPPPGVAIRDWRRSTASFKKRYVEHEPPPDAGEPGES